MYSIISRINEYSNLWAIVIWPVIYQSALLACVIYLITRYRKFSASLRFGLWMLVPLRMLIMPIATVPLPVLPSVVLTEPVYFDEQVIDTNVQRSPGIINSDNRNTPAVEAQDFELNTAKHVFSPTSKDNNGISPGLFTCLFCLWASGVIVFLLRIIAGYLKINRIIRNGKPVEGRNIIEIARQAADAMGLRRLPAVVSTKENISSFVHGVLRPVVVIPEIIIERFSKEQLLVLFTHEFTHLKRRDPLIGWIVSICQIFYFFHPVYYFARHYILLDREMACDDHVISINNQSKSVYARTLVNAGNVCSKFNYQFAPKAVMTESYTHLHKRLLHIAGKPDNSGRMSIKAVTGLILMGFICIPGITLTNIPAEVKADIRISKFESNDTDIKNYKAVKPNPKPDTYEPKVPLKPEIEEFKIAYGQKAAAPEGQAKNKEPDKRSPVIVAADAGIKNQKAPEKETDSSSVKLGDEEGIKNNTGESIVPAENKSIIKDEVNSMPVQKISEPESGDAGFYRERGNLNFKKKHFKMAITDFSKAIELNPDSAVTYYLRGNAYFKAGQTDKAISDYNRAIEIDPFYTYAYAQRGYTYGVNKNEYGRAISDLSKAIKLNPDFFVAYAQRGIFYEEKQQYGKALSDYEKAVRLNPGSSYLQKRIGLIVSKKRGKLISELNNFADKQMIKINDNRKLVKQQDQPVMSQEDWEKFWQTYTNESFTKYYNLVSAIKEQPNSKK